MRPDGLRFAFASALDTGRVRKNNEDAIALDEACGVAVLADGMGGYNAGEVAASMATSLICEELSGWVRSLSRPPAEARARLAMSQSASRANRVIYDCANAKPEYSGMGTTLVMLALVDGAALVGHIGDSRAYRLRKRRLERLTRDHSLLQEQIDAGLITPEQASRSVHRNLVTRALGVEPEVTLETHRHEIVEGDTLLLCSDGLTDMLDDDEIAQELAKPGALQSSCQRLIEAANRAGGKDNVSVVLVRVGESSAPGDKSWWSFWR